MANAIDLHIGKRLRRRRRLLGLTQQQVGEAIGVRMQQVQKMESGANRVLPSRLYELAVALNVPVDYFFQGLERPPDGAIPTGSRAAIDEATFSSEETVELLRAYYSLGERARRRILDLAKALRDEAGSD